ncbi:MAG: hypothetical protein ABFD20_12890, partial [Anaerolineales bacterium]
MTRATDARVIGAQLWLLPVKTRVPLKFGTETLTDVTCARVALTVRGRHGQVATGWGETPLSVQWVWPGELSYATRHTALVALCRRLVTSWASFDDWGHALELGSRFQQRELSLAVAAEERVQGVAIPWLAALVCCSPFDLALHDAYARLVERPVYATYGPDLLNDDLATYLEPAEGADVS